MAADYKATLKAMTLSQLKKHQKEYPEDTNITDAINAKHDAINAKHSERISGKVKDAGPKFFNLFPGMLNSTQEENSSPLMKEFEFLKREKGMSEGEARHYLENKRSDDPKTFEEEFNIGSYRDLSSAFDHGWDSAKVLDTSGILRTTNASAFPNWEDIKTAGGKALTGLESLFFSPLNAAENKDSFILPEKKYRTSNVYDDIGQHSERRIQEKPFSENYNYDKANFLGIDSEAQDIANREFAADPTFQTSEEEEEYNEYLRSIEQMPTIKDPNIFQRFRNNFYKPAAGAVNYGGETYSPAQLNQMNALGGYYSEPARAQRRWEKRQTNVLNRAAAGKPVGNVDLLLGEQGYTSDGDGGISFTGTPQGDPTAGAGYSRSDDSWSASTFKQGGRVRYAEGGIVNLLPKGAW